MSTAIRRRALSGVWTLSVSRISSLNGRRFVGLEIRQPLLIISGSPRSPPPFPSVLGSNCLCPDHCRRCVSVAVSATHFDICLARRFRELRSSEPITICIGSAKPTWTIERRPQVVVCDSLRPSSQIDLAQEVPGPSSDAPFKRRYTGLTSPSFLSFTFGLRMGIVRLHCLL